MTPPRDPGRPIATDLDAFFQSVETGVRPAPAHPLVQAVWHGLRGEWTMAHALAQDDTSAAGARIHGWLHRIEGDHANAAYWYRRAGADPFTGPTDDEGRAIAADLLRA